MRTWGRFVVDTNVLVSAIVLPGAVSRQAIDKALDKGVLLFSEATMTELAAVLLRPKFDRYSSRKDRELFLRQLGGTAEFVSIIHLVRECRDPKDDEFLEVALSGKADLILTGDADLLALNPWRGIGISSPGDYLRR